MNTKLLLIATAILELATGIALLVTPSLIVELLLGEGLGSAASIVVSRVAGSALIAIGITSWLGRDTNRGVSQMGLLVGLLTYNCAVPFLLVSAVLSNGMHGIALWPAVILHSLLAL